MGAYREQLLRERYGNQHPAYMGSPEEGPPMAFTLFKLKFTICLFLFAGFAWMSMTGNSLGHITAQQIVEAVTEEDLSVQLSELGLYEWPDE